MTNTTLPRLADLTNFPAIPAAYFMALNPTRIESCHGIHFYEDPVYGDGQALWAVIGRTAYLTGAWDAGDLECDSGIFAED